MEIIGSKPPLLVYLFALQVVVFLVIFLDIEFARQVIVSLYLIFIPGYVLLKALRIEISNKTELILFSVGLSIAFVMLIGLLLNSLSFVQEPLSTLPILLVTSVCVLLISFLSYIWKREEFILGFPRDMKVSHLVPYFLLPLLGVVGMLLVRASGNNSLLILTIIVISVFLALGSFGKIPASHYPFAIVSLAATLLLMTFLTSNYLNGFDVHFEYTVFSATKNISYWNPSLGLNVNAPYAWMYFYVSNSMLGSTIYPVVFSNLANIAGTQVFNILYPLIFSLVPLALYQFLKEQWGKKVAFLSVLFFISNAVFFDFRNNSRQMLADLFFIVLFLIFFKKDMKDSDKWLLIPFFGFGLLTSYYMLNYVFLALILLTGFFASISNRAKKRKISLTAVFFLVISTFVWYIYVSWGPFDRLIQSLSYNITNAINELFFFGTRSGQVLYATDILASPNLLHQGGRIIFYVSVALILIGFFILVVKRNKQKLDSEYRILTYISMFALSLVIILPRFAYELQLTKWYHTTLIFLSPLFVLGGLTFFKVLLRPFVDVGDKKKRYAFAMITMVLVPFFLFQTGFMYEVMEDAYPSSIPLSGYRMDDLTRLQYNLINERDFYGASWLSEHTDSSDRRVYSDVVTLDNVFWITLMDYDMANRILFNGTAIFESPSYIFLSDYDTKTGSIWNKISFGNETWKFSEISILDTDNDFKGKIYSNGASEVHYYQVP